MKIAVASAVLSGGTGKQVTLLADGLAKRGHEVTVIGPQLEAPIRPPALAALERVGPELRRLGPLGAPLRYFAFAIALRGAGLGRFDVIHVHGWHALALRGVRRQTVCTFHGSALDEALHARPSSPAGLAWLLWQAACVPLERLAGRVPARVTGVSPATATRLKRVSVVIPNAVDLGCYSPAPAGGADPAAVLCVSTGAGGRKRVGALIDAFAGDVRPRLPAAELWLVLPREIPVPAGVRCFVGLSEAELADRYRRATVFCLPSSYEAFGVPYVEAMACGAPVVATPNAGARWVLADGRFGVLCDPGALGCELVALLESPQRLARLAESGLRRAQDFSLESVLDRYEQVYAELDG